MLFGEANPVGDFRQVGLLAAAQDPLTLATAADRVNLRQ
jgi:hypothetical protein